MEIDTTTLKIFIDEHFDARPERIPVSPEINESQRAYALGLVEDVERWAMVQQERD